MQKNWKDASGFKILEQFLGEIEEQIQERIHQDIKNIKVSIPSENDRVQDSCALFPQNIHTHAHTHTGVHTHTPPHMCPQVLSWLSRMRKGQSCRWSKFFPGSSIHTGFSKWIELSFVEEVGARN